MSGSGAAASAAETYRARQQRWSAEVERLAARSRLVSNLRGACFGASAVCAIVALLSGQRLAYASLAALLGVVFVVLVVVHARVIDAEETARRWARVNRDGGRRASSEWRELPDDGQKFADPAHPYADDLDLFGPASLFQRLNVARTHFGQQALAQMLKEPAGAETIVLRQEAARELALRLDERQRLEALGVASADDDEPASPRRKRRAPPPDPEPLLAWVDRPARLIQESWLRVAAFLLPALTLGLLAGAASFGWPATLALGPLLLSVVVLLRTRPAVEDAFVAVTSGEGGFRRYGAMLEVVERLAPGVELLDRLRAETMSGARRPSAAMRELGARIGWFELRHNGLVHPLANALLLWDVHCVLALERWKLRVGSAPRGWLRALGEVEALCSLAALAHDEPSFAWAEIREDAASARFEARSLGHPLLDATLRVANDVTIPTPGTALLVTGSNMSGKSTLLRSMGLAVVMALAGAPACASRLSVPRCRLFTSLRAADSLAEGTSRFYAELRKLAAAVAAAQSGERVLFLLDEILHGTNSRERQIGARWLLAELLAQGALGALTTHDLELCRLPEPLMHKVEQAHFRESVSGTGMTFDYTLRPGPVSAGNALRLMRQMGLRVPLPDGS
jgi:hypothetical protein